jgi:hypothetical protein
MNFVKIWGDITAFKNALDELYVSIAKIHEIETQQIDALSKGATQDKADIKGTLISLILKIGGIIYVYAFENGNKELTAKMNLNKSQLFRLDGNSLLATAYEIIAKANEISSDLANYGITKEDLQGLEKCTEDFDARIVKPRTIITEHKLHTTNLTQVFIETDSILYDKLDKLINLFKISDPDFYLSYKNARNVINLSPRKKKKETDEEKTDEKTEK